MDGSSTSIISTFVGMSCEFGATIVGTLGKQLVSYSGRLEPESRKRRMYKAWGLVLTTVIGPILDASAYAFAPQAVIAPLNGLDIVWNMLLAPYTLGEVLTHRHIIGSVLIFIGAVGSSAVGPHTEARSTLERMESTFLTWHFFYWVVGMVVLLMFCLRLLSMHPKVGRYEAASPIRGAVLALTAGGVQGQMYFINLGLGGFTYSVSSGEWDLWLNPLPYFVLLGGVLCALGNIPFMTKGLQEYDAVYFIAICEGAHIGMAVVTAQVVLFELDDLVWWRKMLYAFALLIIMLGLAIVHSTVGRFISRPIVDNQSDGCSNDDPTSDSDNVERNLYGDQEASPKKIFGLSAASFSSSSTSPSVKDNGGNGSDHDCNVANVGAIGLPVMGEPSLLINHEDSTASCSSNSRSAIAENTRLRANSGLVLWASSGVAIGVTTPSKHAEISSAQSCFSMSRCAAVCPSEGSECNYKSDVDDGKADHPVRATDQDVGRHCV